MKATLIVIAMAVRSTLAATYYVAPTGADTHPGTLAQPFRTIQKAADIVVPGDIVHVCPGIYAGLIGISCGQQNWPNIHHNVIHNMSSIGILTSEDGGKGPHNGEFHDNLVYDCNINLRIHHYNRAKDNQRREFHYRNRFYEPEGIGESIYVHWLDDKWYPETEHPEIWLYHNSFAGGQRAMSPSNFSVKGGGLQRTRMLNNIFSSPVFFYASETFIGSPAMIELCDYNWIGGKLHHGKPAWFGEHNTVAEGKHMWPPGNLPSFTLTAHSPACGKGLDLSKPFMLGGKIHDPLPGMKPGYFLGSTPDCGALQFGETPTRE